MMRGSVSRKIMKYYKIERAAGGFSKTAPELRSCRTEGHELCPKQFELTEIHTVLLEGAERKRRSCRWENIKIVLRSP
jgi:hypothetical protein